MSTYSLPAHSSLKGKVTEAEWQARVDLACAYRMVAHHGWDDLVFTHISARVPGEEGHFLINPYGLLFEEVTASNLVKVNMHFFDKATSSPSGVYNLGSGRAQTFNDVALATLNTLRDANGESRLSLSQAVDGGHIHYIDFPEALKGKYQCYTQADLTNLRKAGYTGSFYTVEEGVGRYVQRLIKKYSQK